MYLTTSNTKLWAILLPLLALASPSSASKATMTSSAATEAATLGPEAADCRYVCLPPSGREPEGFEIDKNALHWHNLTLSHDSKSPALEGLKKIAGYLEWPVNKKHKTEQMRRLEEIANLFFVWGPAPGKQNDTFKGTLYGFDPCQKDALSFGKQCPQAPACVAKFVDYGERVLYVQQISSDHYGGNPCMKKWAPHQDPNGSE
jgi:hypothetical protein